LFLYKFIFLAWIKNFPANSFSSVKVGCKFILLSFLNKALLISFFDCLPDENLFGVVLRKTDFIGVTLWPYLNNLWTVSERLERIAKHYELIAHFPGNLLSINTQNLRVLSDMNAISPGVKIALDHASWFRREGELVLNIFQNDLRVVSSAFIFALVEGEPCIMIGAIQGIHSGVPSDESLSIFKDLTKDFEGVRPRTLVLEVFSFVAEAYQVKKILAIADENRHHRHPYFGNRDEPKLATNYNEIWCEHGGVPSSLHGFYELPLSFNRKTMEEIPSKKRSMYRRRFDMLDNLKRDVLHNLTCLGK
jgi:uncharacterized protein VirK/YbjX